MFHFDGRLTETRAPARARTHTSRRKIKKDERLSKMKEGDTMAERVAQEFRLSGLLQSKPAAAMPPSGRLEALTLTQAAGMNAAILVSSQWNRRDNIAKSETTRTR